MDITQLETNLEIASIALGVLLILARMGLYVWAAIDHGHPDARREWFQRAVELAVLARGEADQLLHVGAGTPVEESVAKDIAQKAETYLGDHGMHVKLDTDTIRMVLNELRDYQSRPLGFTPPKSGG